MSYFLQNYLNIHSNLIDIHICVTGVAWIEKEYLLSIGVTGDLMDREDIAVELADNLISCSLPKVEENENCFSPLLVLWYARRGESSERNLKAISRG